MCVGILRRLARLQSVMLLGLGFALAAGPEVQEIVRRSVEQNEKDWKAAPQYSFTETDAITKSGKTTRRSYLVVMIDGSPYNELMGEGGEPITGARAAAEKQKLERETARRR